MATLESLLFKNRRWINILKWIWLPVVFGGIVYYISKNHQILLKYLGSVSIPYLLLSMILLLGGKLFFARLTMQSVWGQPWKPTFSQMVYAHSMTQLAKYLPGSVWQFVGLFGLYRTNGLSNVQAGKSILVENTWLLSSAIYFGVGVVTISHDELIFSFLRIPYRLWIQVALVLFILAAWIFTIFIIDRVVFRTNRRSLQGLLSIMLTQMLAWSFIGAAFWVPLLAINQDIHFGIIAIGSFALSWVVGFVTIFAPGGLGVREAMLTILLSGLIPAEASLIYAAVNRFAWIFIEICLGIFCELFFGSGKLSNLFKSGETAAKENIH